MKLLVKLLCPGAKAPARAHPSDAGLDLVSPEDWTVRALGHLKVPLGVALALPPGHCGVIAGRSGLATRGVHVLGGIVDEGFRGEVCVILRNTSSYDLRIRAGHKVAQLLVVPVPEVVVELADELPETSRGAGGFGSTGV